MLSAFSQTQKGIFYALFGFSAFVISDSCAKYLSADYPVLMVVAWMYLGSLLFGVMASPFMGGMKATLGTRKLKFHIGRGACNFGLAVSVVTAFQNLPLTSVYPVLFTAPFMVTMGAMVIYKERVAPISWGIIALGFSGVVIAFKPWTGEINPWIFSAFITAMCASGLGLLARPLDDRETLLSLSFYPNLFNVVLLLPFVMVVYGAPDLSHVLVFMLGGMALTGGITGVGNAFRHAPFAFVAPIHYTQLILVFIIGYFVFGEMPDAWMIAGSLVIAASGVMLSRVRAI